MEEGKQRKTFPKKQSTTNTKNVPSDISSAKLKKKKRDIERLLKKVNLQADLKLEKQKALQAINIQLQTAQVKQTSQKYSKKYHMVRFFEKKKALRKYNQIKKEYDLLNSKEETLTAKKELKKMKKKLNHAETDLLYVVNFPRDQKYISIYPKNSDADDEKSKKQAQKTEEKRQNIRKLIREKVASGNILISLNDILSNNVNVNKLIEEAQNSVVIAEPDRIEHQIATTGKKLSDDTEGADVEDDFFE